MTIGFFVAGVSAIVSFPLLVHVRFPLEEEFPAFEGVLLRSMLGIFGVLSVVVGEGNKFLPSQAAVLRKALTRHCSDK